MFTGDGCVEYIPCGKGEFNTGLNVCQKCDPGCETCDDFSGRCNKCLESFMMLGGACSKWRRLSRTSESRERRHLVEDTCPIKVGAIDSPEGCLQTAYSDSRVVPIYEDNSQQVDWRQWHVVGPVQD